MVMVGIDSGSLTAQVGDLVLVVGGHFAMFYICQTNCCNGFAVKTAPLMLSGVLPCALLHGAATWHLMT